MYTHICVCMCVVHVVQLMCMYSSAQYSTQRVLTICNAAITCDSNYTSAHTGDLHYARV